MAGWERDIVRDFVNSCRKYGVKPGIYIGIRWNSFLGVHDFMMPKDGTKFQENRQAFYNKMCEGMTEELMSRYGDLAIVWYDGGGHGPELGGADILPIVEKYQKNIISTTTVSGQTYVGVDRRRERLLILVGELILSLIPTPRTRRRSLRMISSY